MGLPAIKFSSGPRAEATSASDLVQCWIAGTDGQYALLEPGVPVTVSGVTFAAILPEIGSNSAGGSVPVVGTLGLFGLCALLLGVGCWVAARRCKSVSV
jgi:hypothetical protein